MKKQSLFNLIALLAMAGSLLVPSAQARISEPDNIIYGLTDGGVGTVVDLRLDLNGDPLVIYTIVPDTNAGEYYILRVPIDVLDPPTQDAANVGDTGYIFVDDIFFTDIIIGERGTITRLYLTIADTDQDGLPDSLENDTCTDVNDADTDDDGLLDGEEDANQNEVVDVDQYGNKIETDPCDNDTDKDGLQDGMESGLTLNDIGGHTDTTKFIPDADPSTTTDPLSSDSDGDGLSDGAEDPNGNGRVDPGETDPNWWLGDINGNGAIDLADAILVLQVLTGFSPNGIHLEADVNGDFRLGFPEFIFVLEKKSELR